MHRCLVHTHIWTATTSTASLSLQQAAHCSTSCKRLTGKIVQVGMLLIPLPSSSPSSAHTLRLSSYFAPTMPVTLPQLTVVVTLLLRCFYLKTLILTVNHYEIPMSILSTTICGFSYLKSAMVCCDISFAVFWHFASLPMLTSLLLQLNIENFTDTDTDTDLLAFPSLHNL